MPILDDVLARAPHNWEPKNYNSTMYYELQVYGQENYDVLVNFPEDLKAQVKRVHRIQNPFLWGRYAFRKEHLQAKGDNVHEVTCYHPINAEDKTKVMEYNLDYRRYSHKSYGQYCSTSKQPYLYTDPKEAKNVFTSLCGVYTSCVLVVVKTLKTQFDYCSLSKFTKEWDTDYYPAYFVEF